jgi:hypothetical protein
MVKGRDYAKRHRAFNQKILNRIARDPKFRKALLTDAQGALRKAGLEGALQDLEALEVEPGLALRACAPLSCVNTCKATCKSNTCLSTTSC